MKGVHMEKRKHSFNIIDAVVILIVAAAVSLLIWRAANGRKGGDTVALTYVMQTLQGSVDDMISEEMASNVQPGDGVYDSESGRRIGTVAACDSRPAQYTSAGGVVTEVAGYKTLYITCEATSVDEGGRLTVDGVPVSTGKTYTLMFPNLFCRAECISVETARDGAE